MTLVEDSPVHYNVDHYVESADALVSEGLPEPVSWGQDDEGAYRKLHATPANVMYFILVTHMGATLWRHRVAMFGARGAVWAYNRFADAVMHIARVYLAIMAVHYVDDTGAVDAGPIAQSGFDAYERMCELLRIRLKKSKRQPPTAVRDALGVVIALSPEAAQVKPRETRRVKMLGQKRGFVEADRLSPNDAERFAGKLNFYNTAVFGYLGRAALRPLYFRAYANGCPRGAPLTRAISAALDSIEFNLNFAPPRIIPFAVRDRRRPCAYADAFFEIGGEVTGGEMSTRARRRLRHSEVSTLADERRIQLTNLAAARNGWGFIVVGPSGAGVYACGTIPKWFLQKLPSKKTFIFLIETIAQCLALWFCAPELGSAYWAFCDNVGARFSLAKGYTKDVATNAVVSLFWHAATEVGTAPWFEHVPSAAQLADGVSRGDRTLPEKNGWDELDLQIDDLWELLLQILDEGGIAQWRHLRALQDITERERRRSGR